MAWFDISLDAANNLYAWGWRASVAGAVITAAGVLALMWGTRVRDHDFAQNMAQLHNSAALAEKKSNEIEKENLNLQKNLESERIARLKLEKAIKPRSISPQQEEILLAALSNAPKGRVYVVPDWSDPEARMFGRQVSTLLEKVGFLIEDLSGPNKPLSYAVLGAFFAIRDKDAQPPHLAPLYRAFRNAGFEYSIYEENYVPDAESVVIGISAK